MCNFEDFIVYSIIGLLSAMLLYPCLGVFYFVLGGFYVS